MNIYFCQLKELLKIIKTNSKYNKYYKKKRRLIQLWKYELK